MAVHVERSSGPGEVLTFTLDRPERRNALDHTTLDELRHALGNAMLEEVRVLVVTGAGGHFCAGADLSGVEDEGFVQDLHHVLSALHGAPFPVVAAIEGAALGAGTQLAMACDLRVATPSATFGIPAAKLGLTIDHWTAHHLARQVGAPVARAMLVGAEVFTAEVLHTTGFVHRLAADPSSNGESLGGSSGALAAALAWAAELATLAPLTIAAHKAMLQASESGEPAPADVDEARALAWNSSDLQEGLAAFRERRKPEFRGV